MNSKVGKRTQVLTALTLAVSLVNLKLSWAQTLSDTPQPPPPTQVPNALRQNPLPAARPTRPVTSQAPTPPEELGNQKTEISSQDTDAQQAPVVAQETSEKNSAASDYDDTAQSESDSAKFKIVPVVRGHEAKPRTGGTSLAPIIGYDPTYGVLLGGAVFHSDSDSPVTSGSLVLTGTLHGNYALVGSFRLWTKTHWYAAIEVGATHFFDSYFGEGDRTRLADQIKIQNYKHYAIPAIGYRWNEHNALVFSAELKFRRETAVNDDTTRRVFGNEYTPAFDAAWVYDSRDNRDDTKFGRYFQGKLYFGPKALSTRQDAENFLKILLELKQFYSLFSFITVGAHIQGGVTLGEPGYQYRFNLGGSSDLRGYQSDRLRGRHFYEAQAEARVQLVKWLSVVGFWEIGDTAEVSLDQFHGAKITKGGGLRIGLPPDYVAKARLDFGVAPDEKNFYLSFNEAF